MRIVILIGILIQGAFGLRGVWFTVSGSNLAYSAEGIKQVV